MTASPSPTREAILAALGRVAVPGGGDLVSRDLVRALVVDHGAVRFVIEAESPEAARALEPARIAAEPSPNLRAPVAFDLFGSAPLTRAVAIYAANVVHIAPWPATERLFAHANALLDSQGIVVLYGPFRYADRSLEPSNEAFDAQLRAGDPDRGIRDLDAVLDVAAQHGFRLAGDRPMPANNRTLWFARTPA